MFNLIRKRGTLTVETVLQAPVLPPTSWTPQELSEPLPDTFRDPWADDSDRTTRRETYRTD